MASGQRSRELVVDGRRLAIANLDRVVFPQAGTTKAQLLDYYLRVADAMLPHLRDRLLHMHRYPEGVGGPSFWQKACPEFRPEWIQTVPVWSRDKHDNIEFCVIDETAALLWAVNIGSIELHTSLHRRDDLHRPTAMAFDLDPGEGVGLPECCAVGLRIRDLFAGVGLLSLPKTSGGKGLQVFVPLNSEVTYAQTKPVARGVAEMLEAQTPDRVVSRMAKALRRGKVLVDWSQNTESKTTICVWSLRARERPTVSTPVSWDEIAEALDEERPELLAFEAPVALERAAAGDLWAEVETLEQELPDLGAS
jgi:bifunctional non-homologous end joining protein LigD